jgi:tRNA threonylcarbamoyl adenosine modification protein YeaZ
VEKTTSIQNSGLQKTSNSEPRTPHPVYLGLDTATPFLSLALWNEAGTLATFSETIGRDHAKRIMLEIDNLFEQAQIKPLQLAGVGVGVGPGSYTGVRVGIATAKAMAKGLTIPVVGVTTLSAMAFAALGENEQGVVALDARKGSVYAGVFEKQKGEMLELSPIQKIERSVLQAQHPTLAYVQDVCPDASYIARIAAAKTGMPVEAIYL